MRSTTYIMVFLTSAVMLSQLKHPKVSPGALVKQEVGFTTITIDYSRPAVRGRKIFGNLVPYGRIWRVGANESTKISVDTELVILGNTLEPGTYALYAFPQEKEWELVFHANTTHWGDGRKKYNPEEDVFRVKVETRQTKTFQENLLIAFEKITHNAANLVLHWANTKVELPIEVDTNEIMERHIQSKMSDKPSAQTYYEAARYYVEQGRKSAIALSYLNEAIALGGDTYYFHRVKSLVEAELGDFKGAIASASKSLALAEAQGKDEFVRMNQKNIDAWLERLKN